MKEFRHTLFSDYLISLASTLPSVSSIFMLNQTNFPSNFILYAGKFFLESSVYIGQYTSNDWFCEAV
jgi:hypothetical protein